MRSKQRVFVSSVVDGFGQFREAARGAIVAAGGEPVLVNEDLPALATSSRNACLDVIDSCDYFVSIIGSRGGWTAPSGKLVVEEEYEHARARKMPVLAFEHVELAPRLRPQIARTGFSSGLGLSRSAALTHRQQRSSTQIARPSAVFILNSDLKLESASVRLPCWVSCLR
jgi:hypothetical protein